MMASEPIEQINHEAAKAYLNEITVGWSALPEEAVIELRCLFPHRQTDVQHFDHTPEGIADLIAHADAMNRTGLNTYVIVNPVRASIGRRAATDDDIIAAFFWWADADDEAAADRIRNYAGPRFGMHVVTGRIPYMRPHIYWRIAEGPVFDLAAWTAQQVNVADNLDTDRTVVNPSRIMRLPGFVNWPNASKVAKGRVSEISEFVRRAAQQDPVTLDQMARAFPPVRRTATTSPAGAFQFDTGHHSKDVADFADILTRARTDGHKHGGVRDLAASLAGQGVSRALAEAIVRQACPVWDANVEDLLNSAYAKFYRQNDPPELTFDVATIAEVATGESLLEWFDDITPSLGAPYLIKGVLDQTAMSVVYGPSNSGKTFFAIDMAFHIAAGLEYRGRRVVPSGVLYLAAEGGRAIKNRISALRIETGLCEIPFALRRAGLDLLKDNADLQSIVNLAAEVKARNPEKPILIVVDTLSRVMAGGDENSAADMTALIRNIDAIREITGAHIMLVHHTGKDTARGARGHSSLRAATDTEIEVGAPEDGGAARLAMVTKQRDHTGGEVFAFTLRTVALGVDEDGDDVATCVVEVADAAEAMEAARMKKGLGGNQKAIADTFDQMVADGMSRPNPGGVGLPDPGRFHCVDADELRRISQGKMVGSDPGKLFRQAWKALTDERGLFCAADKLVWRTDRRIS